MAAHELLWRHGFPFPVHPTCTRRWRGEKERLKHVLLSLEEAASALGVTEKPMHLTLCELRGQVMAKLRDLADSNPLAEEDLFQTLATPKLNAFLTTQRVGSESSTGQTSRSAG